VEARRRPLGPVPALLAALAIAFAMSACGAKEKTSGVEGDYIHAGDVVYQVQLSRLLNSAALAFDESALGQEHYAQAFTFVDFLLGSAGEKYRLRFLEFLRNTYRGKGAPPQFFDALQLKGPEVESEWLAWVKAQAAAAK